MIYLGPWRFPLVVVLGVILFLISVSLVMQPKVAHAASFVSCSGNGCNGQDPHTTGCDRDGSTAGARVGIYEGSRLLGYVENRYSRTCGTNWALVYTNDNSVTYMGGEIIRSDGLHLCYPRDCRTFYSNRLYTDMVYDPTGKGMTAKACGYISGRNSEPGACTPYY